MKKIFAILSALVMIFSLSACGGEKIPVDDIISGLEQAAGEIEKAGQEIMEQLEEQIPAENGFIVPEYDQSLRTSDLEITRLETDKRNYAPGEDIKVIIEWNGTPDSSAWVGTVPAEIPHGDEYANDDADIEYYYLSDYGPGEYVFETDLEPGKYTVRINENDSEGVELAWVSFTVTDGTVPEEENTDPPVAGEPDEPGETSAFATKTLGWFTKFALGGDYTVEMITEYEGTASRSLSVYHGDKIYTESEYEGTKSVSIIMDGVMYIIDHASNLVMKMPLNMATTAEIFSDSAEYYETAVTTGEIDIKGKNYYYEEFDVEGEAVKYCFDDDELKYMYMNTMGTETLIEIVRFGKGADESLFEIPENYSVMDLTGGVG